MRNLSAGDWRPITSEDPELPLYNRSTALTSLGADTPTAQYSFVGTGIWYELCRASDLVFRHLESL
jgi:hypothetical protein